MRRVIIESPFAGDIVRNREYLLACMRHSLSVGEAPFASHGLYTQCLDDFIPGDREKGIAAGFSWGEVAEATVVYCDLGLSPGMTQGIDDAVKNHRPLEWRWLGGVWAP